MATVRFAPSPTGFLHIGGARTALFNWMYARAQKGKFILRIEDTDLQRSEQKYVEEILDSMAWLGMNWDDVFYQSKRFDIYREHAKKLIEQDKAYKEGEAVILKIVPQEIKLYDLIRDEIAFDSDTIKDQVLLKSDGSPTYSFACVVDDALMEVSHVIRGEDHISNTPKQMLIAQALEFKFPKFAHLPLIMGEDGTRLSKRTGAVAVSDYRDMGFLPEAIVNYLMLLGWSPGADQEKITTENAIKKFSIKKVNKAAAIFSMEKLRWLNGEYIKEKSTGDLAELLTPLLRKHKYIDESCDKKALGEMVELFKRRMPTLQDFCERADFFFVDKPNFDQQAKEKHLSKNRSGEFNTLGEALSALEEFSIQKTEEVFRSVAKELGLEVSEMVHPVRVALTGREVGPGLFETMAALGKEKTVKRLKEAFV